MEDRTRKPARRIHATYWRIRHRVTGLFHAGKRRDVLRWSSRGALWRNARAIHGYLLSLPEVPREWDVVPVELVVRDDRAMSARVYKDLHVLPRYHRGRKRRKRRDGDDAAPVPPGLGGAGLNADEWDSGPGPRGVADALCASLRAADDR